MMIVEAMVTRGSPDGLVARDASEYPRIGPVEPAMPRLGSLDTWTATANPGDVFRHPREVLAHPSLTAAEKRAILAAWASDTHAVESCPSLRCLAGCRAEPVPVDAVLDALQALDAPSVEAVRPALN